jgi:D-amino-acid oxidase
MGPIYARGVRTTIIGAGVSGLTVATVMIERGWHGGGDEIVIAADRPFEDCVSSVAAAVWTMTEAEPIDATMHRALASRQRFAALALDPESGVRPLPQRELHRVPPPPSPWEGTPWVRRLLPQEVPEGYGGGFAVDGFSIDPTVYLSGLRDRLRATGVRIEVGRVSAFDDVDGDLLVNCSGLGARALSGDADVHPIRGQVVIVGMGDLPDGVSDEDDPTRIAYVYPRRDTVVLGGQRTVGDESTEVDDGLTARIRNDCARLDPRIAGAPVREVRVGHRPGRSEVRVEAEVLPDGRTVVHDYGHAGAGFILSWGCADEAATLAAASRP